MLLLIWGIALRTFAVRYRDAKGVDDAIYLVRARLRAHEVDPDVARQNARASVSPVVASYLEMR
jgi:hypothetical protein